MALPKVAALIAERLNTTGAKWMATGSIASMSYGEYRVTSHPGEFNAMLAITDVDQAFLEREIAQRGLGDLWKKCL